jgi:hypothetical protein
MPYDQRILTIVHISDLHIGQLDQVSGDAETNATWARLYASHNIFDGLLGHKARALEHLEIFYQGLAEEEPLLVVSGDATRVGNSQSFSNANDYLSTKLNVPALGRAIGLDRADWKRRAIPGNHDRWAGQAVIVGGPTATFNTFFHPLPTVVDVPLYGNQVVLRIGMLDTDIDVGAYSPSRVRAVGSFQSQLARLAAQFGPLRTNAKEVRVLLMHHSWHRQTGALSIEGGSLQALNSLLDSEDIKVLLTGHMHSVYIKDFIPVPGGDTVWECRCGTSAVHDKFPLAWRTLAGNHPTRPLDPNTLLVHRLTTNSRDVNWEVQCYVRKKRGFEIDSSQTKYFDV